MVTGLHTTGEGIAKGHRKERIQEINAEKNMVADVAEYLFRRERHYRMAYIALVSGGRAVKVEISSSLSSMCSARFVNTSKP